MKTIKKKVKIKKERKKDTYFEDSKRKHNWKRINRTNKGDLGEDKYKL